MNSKNTILSCDNIVEKKTSADYIKQDKSKTKWLKLLETENFPFLIWLFSKFVYVDFYLLRVFKLLIQFHY